MRKQRLIRLLTFLFVLFSGMIVIVSVPNLLPSFVLALVICYLLTPLINALERFNLTRVQAIFFSFFFISLIIGIGIFLSLPAILTQIASIKNELPNYTDGLGQLILNIEKQILTFAGPQVYDLHLAQKAQDIIAEKGRHLFSSLHLYITQSLTVAVLAPFFAFFILKDGRIFVQKILSIVPNHLFEVTLNLSHHINKQMGQFVRARLLEAAFVGVIVLIGLILIGFPYAFILSFFAALMNLIPYVGPFIGVAPPLIIAFIHNEPSLTYALLLTIYGVSQVLDMLIIIPLVVAKIVNLHPVMVVLSIIIGAELMGVLGMIISIPVTSALKVTLATIFKQSLNE